MASDLVVRRATRADREAVQRFHRALYIDHRDAIGDPDVLPFYAYHDFERVLREDVDVLLSDDTNAVLLAERDGRPIGYATGHVEQEPRRVLPRKGVVEDWYVVPEERGHGAGRLLLEMLIAIFREAGCQVVESATWPFNTGARAAHEHLDFREVEVKYRKRID